jgi:hypothetical protein
VPRNSPIQRINLNFGYGDFRNVAGNHYQKRRGYVSTERRGPQPNAGQFAKHSEILFLGGGGSWNR